MWQIDSWREKKYLQQVEFPDLAKLQEILQQLNNYESLISINEIEQLRQRLSEVARGNAFIIQGGDCTESFANWNEDSITRTIHLLLEQADIYTHYCALPIILIARAAGLYAKPRSSLTETKEEIILPNYRGDMINRAEFTQRARTPDPSLMKKAYDYSLATIKHIQSLSNDIFLSRETLVLEYEQQLTRKIDGQWYNCATHFPWIGMRTLDLESAHVEYMRGISNPIAIKISATIKPEAVIDLIKILNPDNQASRLTLIHRYGVNEINENLPALIKAVQNAKRNVIWMCDPMHGNTYYYQGIKTRNFADISKELVQSVKIHQGMDTYLGGVHLEMTGEAVTECHGGSQGLQPADLNKCYRSPIDPRLNKQQALDLILMFSRIKTSP